MKNTDTIQYQESLVREHEVEFFRHTSGAFDENAKEH
jgi:hypothetical protein